MLRSLAGSALIVLALGVRASAQFDQFDWTFSNTGGDMGQTLSPDLMGIFNFPNLVLGGQSTFTTQSPVAGRVSVHADLTLEEGTCGASVPLLIQGEVNRIFSTCEFYDTIVFDVDGSETFGFGLKVNDPAWFASLYLSSFTFTPYWAALGGALGGSAGEPSLSGSGILQPEQAISITLDHAAPVAPVALILGLSEASVSFKGGVLVPSPDRVIAGLVTDADGVLVVAGTLPGGTLPAASIIGQAWIVDSGGPKGFAASNALEGLFL